MIGIKFNLISIQRKIKSFEDIVGLIFSLHSGFYAFVKSTGWLGHLGKEGFFMKGKNNT